MSIWNDFASLIGVAPRHAEDALYSERAARATLSRRSMLSASAALATGVAFGFAVPEPQVFYVDTDSIVLSHIPEWLMRSMASMSVMALYYHEEQNAP